MSYTFRIPIREATTHVSPIKSSVRRPGTGAILLVSVIALSIASLAAASIRLAYLHDSVMALAGVTATEPGSLSLLAFTVLVVVGALMVCIAFGLMLHKQRRLIAIAIMCLGLAVFLAVKANGSWYTSQL